MHTNANFFKYGRDFDNIKVDRICVVDNYTGMIIRPLPKALSELESEIPPTSKNSLLKF